MCLWGCIWMRWTSLETKIALPVMDELIQSPEGQYVIQVWVRKNTPSLSEDSQDITFLLLSDLYQNLHISPPGSPACQPRLLDLSVSAINWADFLLPTHTHTDIYIWCGLICSIIQLCPTLCNPMDCSPLGSSIHGISQARIQEWVAISSSRGSSQHRDQTCVSGIGRQIL